MVTQAKNDKKKARLAKAKDKAEFELQKRREEFERRQHKSELRQFEFAKKKQLNQQQKQMEAE